MPDLAYMIDASHNLKDPIEDLIQATDQIQVTIAQALLVDRDALADAQDDNDPAARRRGAAARRTAPTCARSSPRRVAATAPRSTRSRTFRRLGYRAAMIAERGDGRRGDRAVNERALVTGS